MRTMSKKVMSESKQKEWQKKINLSPGPALYVQLPKTQRKILTVVENLDVA